MYLDADATSSKGVNLPGNCKFGGMAVSQGV